MPPARPAKSKRAKTKFVTQLRAALGRFAAVIVVALLCAAIALWWTARWKPSRDDFPIQGISIGADNGVVHWGSIKASGADFVYLQATDGAQGVDDQFLINQSGATGVGLRSGAIHRYRLCALASDQAANLIRQVPRDRGALPPAIWLDLDQNCEKPPSRALLLSELATFLAQIEAHMGKRTIVAPSAEFDEIYAVSGNIARTTWVRGNFFEPGYGAHPWTMWQANPYLRVAGADGTVGWSVVGKGKAQ